jgi:hypothetical protein
VQLDNASLENRYIPLLLGKTLINTVDRGSDCTAVEEAYLIGVLGLTKDRHLTQPRGSASETTPCQHQTFYFILSNYEDRRTENTDYREIQCDDIDD